MKSTPHLHLMSATPTRHIHIEAAVESNVWKAVRREYFKPLGGKNFPSYPKEGKRGENEVGARLTEASCNNVIGQMTSRDQKGSWRLNEIGYSCCNFVTRYTWYLNTLGIYTPISLYFFL